MRLLLPLTSLILLITVSPAWAHRLLSESKLTQTDLVVEAYFDDDTPAQEAKVSVWKENEKFAEGKTDERGVWKMPRPVAGTYEIKVESVGHLSKETIEISDEVVAASSENTSEPTHTKPKTPWFAVGAGLLVIAGLAFLARFLKKNPSLPPPSTNSAS